MLEAGFAEVNADTIRNYIIAANLFDTNTSTP